MEVLLKWINQKGETLLKAFPDMESAVNYALSDKVYFIDGFYKIGER